MAEYDPLEEHIQSMRAKTRQFHVVVGDCITPQPVSWLWEGYLAGLQVNLLAGAPGSGKTTLALAMAAAVSTGGLWPDGTAAPLGDVLIWSGEDSRKSVLVPRLLACGADLKRILFIDGMYRGEQPYDFNPARDFATLRSALQVNRAWRLLIVDTVVSAVAGGLNSGGAMRKSLESLGALARDFGLTVLGVAHFSKGHAGRDPLERIGGSVNFAAYARLVLAVAGRKPHNGGKFVLTRAKSNLGPDGGGFVYDIEQVETPGNPGLRASRVVWGEALKGSAAQILEQAENEEADAADEAAGEVDKWLRQLITEEGGSLEAREVLKSAGACGYKRSTVYRARLRLRVSVTRSGFGKELHSLWSLPAAARAADT